MQTHDLIELPDSFNIYFELLGVELKDIEIEFTSPPCITVGGRSKRSKRSYLSSTLSARLAKETFTSGDIIECSKASRADETTAEDEALRLRRLAPLSPSCPKLRTKRHIGLVIDQSVGERSAVGGKPTILMGTEHGAATSLSSAKRKTKPYPPSRSHSPPS
jgi:hypothetical protein